MRRAFLFLLCLTGFAVAQVDPELWGTIFLSVAPTVTDRQTTVWRSDSAGRLTTDIVTGTAGKLLMVDGVSFVLQMDAASKICLAPGC